MGILSALFSTHTTANLIASESSILETGSFYVEGRRIKTNIGSNWVQIHNDIEGESSDDQSGKIVSMSGDGSRLAIGATGNDGNGNGSGHVRVYQDKGSSWEKVHQDIDGEADLDFSGFSVSMSGDGSRLAIGAPDNDGNGSGSGHVRVYQDVGSSWDKVHQDIDVEATNDWSGKFVSISGNGSRVAIGADGNDGNGSGSGHVRVYQDGGSSWDKVHQDIDGEAAGDQSGFSLSMSGDGTRVVIGAHYNDGNGSNSGHVRVYQDNGSSWDKVHQDIDGEAAGDQSGFSVSISGDGLRLAIGAHNNGQNGSSRGHVRVYQDVGSSWDQVSEDIDGAAANDWSGYSVSISVDGSRLAIGAYGHDGNGSTSGHVRVLKDLPTQLPIPVPSPSPTKLPTPTAINFIDQYQITTSIEKFDSNVLMITTSYANAIDKGLVEVFKADCKSDATGIFTLTSNSTYNNNLVGEIDGVKTSINYLIINISGVNGSGVLEQGSSGTEGKIELCLVTTAFEEHNSNDVAIASTKNIVLLPYTSTAASITFGNTAIDELDASTQEIDGVVDQGIRNVSAIRCTANSTEVFSASPQDNTEGKTIYLCLIPKDVNVRLFNINLKAVFGEGEENELTLISHSEEEFLVSMDDSLPNGIVRVAFPIISAFFAEDNADLELTGDVQLSAILEKGAMRIDNKVEYQVSINLVAPHVGCFATLMQRVIRTFA